MKGWEKTKPPSAGSVTQLTVIPGGQLPKGPVPFDIAMRLLEQIRKGLDIGTGWIRLLRESGFI